MSSFNLQRFVMYGSKTLPSVTLFGFVVAQVVFDALGMFPSPALQSWIERNRVELKTLLDRDYRLDHRELEAIRQQLSDTEAGNGSSHSTYYPSRPSSSSSISPTHSPSYNYHINEQRIQALSAELDNRNRALEEQQESLEHTESQLLTATGDLVTLKNQVAYLVKEGDGQSAKIRELEQEILGVQGRYDTIVDERDTLQQSLAETKAQKAELEKEIADLRSQIDNVTAELTQAQEDSQSAQKKYTEEIAALNATIEQVKDLHNKDLEMFTSNVQHLEKDFQSLTARNESLYKQLGDAEIGLKAAAEKQTELERTIEVGETEKKAFQAKEASLNDQVADQTRELEGLKATVAGLETALRTSGDKVDSLETELVEVKRLKDDLETEIVELKKTIAEKQSQADSARNRLTMTRALSGWWSGPSTAAAAA